MKLRPSGSEPKTKQRNLVPKRESSLHSVGIVAELSEVFTIFKVGGKAYSGQ